MRREPRKVLLAVMVPIALGSVAFSIYLTGANPELAYFSTFTRLWESAFGAILAIAAPSFIRMTARASDLLVGAGLVAIVGSAVLITSGTPLSGSIALVPVLGAALVLFGGASVARGSLSRVLLVRPKHVGDISYGLYLWHWPHPLRDRPFGPVSDDRPPGLGGRSPDRDRADPLHDREADPRIPQARPNSAKGCGRRSGLHGRRGSGRVGIRSESNRRQHRELGRTGRRADQGREGTHSGQGRVHSPRAP